MIHNQTIKNDGLKLSRKGLHRLNIYSIEIIVPTALEYVITELLTQTDYGLSSECSFVV